MRDTLSVSEIFGPTIQGEGPSTGRLSTFVRLGLCNLDCSWCDTPYTWDWTGKNGPPQDKAALMSMSLDAIASQVHRIGAPLVVITGGEPLVQRRTLVEFVNRLHAMGYGVEIETNGTIFERALWPDRFNVSPKLIGSGVDPAKAITGDFDAYVAMARHGRAIFKFVIACANDLGQVNELVADHKIPKHAVWLMPVGRTAENITVNGAPLAQVCIDEGFNFSTRLHVLLWGDERGR